MQKLRVVSRKNKVVDYRHIVKNIDLIIIKVIMLYFSRAIMLPSHRWKTCPRDEGRQVEGLLRIVRKFLYSATTVKVLWSSSKRGFPQNWKVE